jgi:hypothetical protein
VEPLVLSWHTDGVTGCSLLLWLELPLHGAAVLSTCYTRLARLYGPPIRFELPQGPRYLRCHSTLQSWPPLRESSDSSLWKGCHSCAVSPHYPRHLATSLDSKRLTKQARLPVPPHPVSTGHGTFRGDKQTGVIFRQTYGKTEFKRDI